MVLLMVFSLAIIVTIIQPALLPILLAVPLLIGSSLFALYWYRKAFCRMGLYILVFLIGIAYANLRAYLDIQAWLPAEFEQQTLVLDIQVKNLPTHKDRYIQYEAEVLHVNGSSATALNIDRIALSDYESKQIEPCAKMQVAVSLKRPHGLANGVGFDYEAYLLEQGIQAKGYVRNVHQVFPSPEFCIHRFRQDWNAFVLQYASASAAPYIIALTSGDKAYLSDEQNDLLLATGTMHLFVISGSHIALAAMSIYLFILLLRRLGLAYWFQGDWRAFATIVSLLGAVFYTLFAGYAMPSIRACIMLTIFMCGSIFGFYWSLWLRYWLCMALMLLIQPLAPLNIGFLLSFGAVAVLILVSERYSAFEQTFMQRCWHWLNNIVRVQWLVFMGLMPLMAIYFGQFSLISPLMNAFAVPVVELFILPLLFIAMLCWVLRAHVLAESLLDGVSTLLDHFFSVMQVAAGYLSQWFTLQPSFYLSVALTVLLLAAVVLYLAPKVFHFRYFAAFFSVIFFVLWSRPVDRPHLLSIDILDVDQGLSVLIQTQHHQLIYDTGSSWPQGSMAERAVLPFVYSQGWVKVDQLIVSHLDNDHAGGAAILSRHFPDMRVVSSEPIAGLETRPCVAGDAWQWDGVHFEFLHPEKEQYHGKRNNRSCVLLIQTADKAILLPGDIDESIEQQLIANLPPLDLLIAPHHGSKTSSSQALVNKLMNQGPMGAVIFSSGYLSRFGHPHVDIEARYQASGVKMFNTALSGRINAVVLPSGVMNIQGFREEQGKYWQKITRPHNHALQ